MSSVASYLTSLGLMLIFHKVILGIKWVSVSKTHHEHWNAIFIAQNNLMND